MLKVAIVLTAIIVSGVTQSVAHAAFSGNVCGLLAANQVATVHVTPLKCTAEKQVTKPGFTAYYGYWGSPTHSFLGITVNRYKDMAPYTGLKQLLRTRVGRTGSPQRVSGIGSYAYEGKSGNHGEIEFVVGHYIVQVAITMNTPLKSFAALNALARVVAGKL